MTQSRNSFYRPVVLFFCIFCKNWLENDVLVGYRDIDLQEIELDSWFQDREIQEFIEQLEKKSNRTISRSRPENQTIFKAQVSSKDLDTNSEINSNSLEEGRLPLPGGLRPEQQEVFDEKIQAEKNIKNKS